MLVNEMVRDAVRRDTMAVEVAAERRRFTREEYRLMGEVGILKPDDRVELIRGEIVKKMAPGRRHRAFVDNLTQLLVPRLVGRAIVSVQNPLVLSDDSEPEPDLKILRRRSVSYKEREAHAEDTLLVIEVADTSLAYDRSTKLTLYAETGVPEYWVVNCNSESIEIYRRPEGDRYLDVDRIEAAATITLHAFPDVTLALAEIFA
jgi:Uma2 family endonuclease